MQSSDAASVQTAGLKKGADYVFYELTRSICPVCRVVTDAQILIRDDKVYMPTRRLRVHSASPTASSPRLRSRCWQSLPTSLVSRHDASWGQLFLLSFYDSAVTVPGMSGLCVLNGLAALHRPS